MTTGAIHECSAHCYNTEVIRQQVTLEVESIDRMYLNVYQTRRGQPALMACTIRGKTGGTRALCRGNRLSRTRYTFHGDNLSTFTAELSVCRVFTTAKRTGRKRGHRALLDDVLLFFGEVLFRSQDQRGIDDLATRAILPC